MSFKRSHGLRAAVAGAGLLALSACNTANKHIGEIDPYFGEALKYDTALQTINPDPVYPASAAKPGSHGDKGARAVVRYRTDAVKPVESVQTNTGSSGSR